MKTLRHNSPNAQLTEAWNIFLRAAGMYGVMILAYLHYVPKWTIVVAIVLLYFSVYISAHEIGHNNRSDKFGIMARLVPLGTPIWGGTRVFQDTHNRHHLYLATSRDPWQHFYKGHPLRAFFFNMIEPEVNAYNYIKARGADAELIANFVYNAACLAAGMYLFREYYLIYFGSSRLVHGLGVFLFNFTVHRNALRADADYGVYERETLLRPVLPLMTLIWGSTVITGYIFHNRHHCVSQWQYHPQDYNKIPDTGVFSRYVRALPSPRMMDLDAPPANEAEAIRAHETDELAA